MTKTIFLTLFTGLLCAPLCVQAQATDHCASAASDVRQKQQIFIDSTLLRERSDLEQSLNPARDSHDRMVSVINQVAPIVRQSHVTDPKILQQQVSQLLLRIDPGYLQVRGGAR